MREPGCGVASTTAESGKADPEHDTGGPGRYGSMRAGEPPPPDLNEFESARRTTHAPSARQTERIRTFISENEPAAGI